MTSVVFSEAFLTISAIAIAVVLTSTLLANIQDINNIQVALSNRMKDRIGISVKIVFASTNDTIVYVWIKNTGIKPVPYDLIDDGDLYFGKIGSESYIEYGSQSTPTWNYTIVNNLKNNSYWDIGETIQVTIYLDAPLPEGDYRVIYIVYTGEMDEYMFSV